MSDVKIPGRIKSIVTDLECRSANGERRISGYASKPTVDRTREVVDVIAFTATLDIFKANPVMLWMHSSEIPIGTWDHIELRPDGLYVSGVLAKGVKAADEAWSLIKQGVVKSLSIGFRELNGEFDLNDIWHITQLELYEVSVVSIPANRDAMFTMGGGKLLSIELGDESTVRIPDGGCKAEDGAPTDASTALPVEGGSKEQKRAADPVSQVEVLIPGWKTGTCVACGAQAVDVIAFAKTLNAEYTLCPTCFCPPKLETSGLVALVGVADNPMPELAPVSLSPVDQQIEELRERLDAADVAALAQSDRLADCEKALLGMVRLQARQIAAQKGIIVPQQ